MDKSKIKPLFKKESNLEKKLDLESERNLNLN